jgi:hypothetical protein
MIQEYYCHFDSLNNEYMSIIGPFKNLPCYFQETMQSNTEYHDDFMALVKLIEEYGGAGLLTYFPNMIKKDLKNMKGNAANATPNKKKDAKKIAQDKFLAALMLNGANCSKYDELKRSMNENYVTGTSNYPKSPEVLLCILNA